jgi:magnesium-transporting ATPase (P-type)
LCFIVGPISQPIDYQTIYLGVVLIIVVVSTGFFAWWQERKSDSVMAGFKALTPARCNVVRDGQVIEIDAKDLVQGDICMVNFGEKVQPARKHVRFAPFLMLCAGPCRLPYPRGREPKGLLPFSCPASPAVHMTSPFQVDNSSLTGEPEPLRRVPECTDESPFETKNLAFYGTFFTEGSGKVVVYATGDRTFLGNIASSTLNTVKNQSTLNIEIHHFIKIMATIAISLGVVFFIVAITAVKYPILEVLKQLSLPLRAPQSFIIVFSISLSPRRLSFLPLALLLPMCLKGCYPRLSRSSLSQSHISLTSSCSSRSP